MNYLIYLFHDIELINFADLWGHLPHIATFSYIGHYYLFVLSVQFELK